MKKNMLCILTVLLVVMLLAVPVSAQTLDEMTVTQSAATLNASESYIIDFTIYGTFDYAEVQDEIDILNEERAKEGLSALTLDPTLTEMAMQRAAECAVYFSHTRPDGSLCFTLIQENDDYYSGSYGENIAAGYTSAADVMEGWMNSEGHRENILTADYNSVGLGCYYQNGTMYWVQLFHSKTASGSLTTSTAVEESSIPISVSTDNLQLHYVGYDDCAVPLYQGCTAKAKVYVTNPEFGSGKIYLSGGYSLESTDTALATTSGDTITGVAPGTLDVHLVFGNVAFIIPYEILPEPELSYVIDSDGNPVITCINEGDAELYYKESGDDMWTQVSVGTDNTFTHYNTSPGEVYTYVVRYYDDDYGWVEVCDRMTVKITVGTPEVSGKNVTSSGKPRLTWDKVKNASEYQVYRATSADGTYQQVYTTTGTSYTNTGAAVGKTYYYYVVAVTSKGVVSEPSAVMTLTCKCARPEVTLSNKASTGKILVKWEEVEGAEKYEVYRATSKNGEYKLLTTTSKTTITNTSAVAGKTYYYKVKAIGPKEAANSAYSEIKNRTCDLPRPDVEISLNSKGKPKLTWEAVDGAVEYKVYRATSKNGDYELLKTTTGTSLTNGSAKSGKTYYYKVKAIAEKSAANSAYSAVDSIKSK